MNRYIQTFFIGILFLGLSAYGESSRRPKTVSDTLNYSELFRHEEDLALFSPVLKKNALPKLKTLTLSMDTRLDDLHLVDDLHYLKAPNLQHLTLYGILSCPSKILKVKSEIDT